jgi:putative hydrolase of the HAD superfamily
MVKAVLFDWGDTLARAEWSENIASEGTAAGLAAIGERDDLPDVAAIGAYFAERADQLFSQDAEDEADLDAITRALFTDLGATLDDAELRRYIDAAHDVWHRYFTVPDESRELLDTLRRRGLRLAIVSNTATPGRLIRPLLAEQGLADRVDTIVLSSELGKRKPHRAIFERALGDVDAPAEQALFVGDRRYQDILGAKRLGMRTALARWFRDDVHPNGAEPDFELRAPLEVAEIVARLNAPA